MEINDSKNTFSTSRVVVSLVLVTLMYAGYHYFLSNKLSRNGVYVVATIQETWTAKNGYKCMVSYHFSGVDFKAQVSSPNGAEVIGERYFMKILPTDPKTADFLNDKRVPDCVLQAPAPEEGWREIPTCN